MENPDAAALETAASEAMAGGTTAFDELRFAAALDHGDLLLESRRNEGWFRRGQRVRRREPANADDGLAYRAASQRIASGTRHCAPPVLARWIIRSGRRKIAGLARFVAERAHRHQRGHNMKAATMAAQASTKADAANGAFHLEVTVHGDTSAQRAVMMAELDIGVMVTPRPQPNMHANASTAGGNPSAEGSGIRRPRARPLPRD